MSEPQPWTRKYMSKMGEARVRQFHLPTSAAKNQLYGSEVEVSTSGQPTTDDRSRALSKSRSRAWRLIALPGRGCRGITAGVWGCSPNYLVIGMGLTGRSLSGGLGVSPTSLSSKDSPPARGRGWGGWSIASISNASPQVIMTLRATTVNENRKEKKFGDTPIPVRGVPLHPIFSEESERLRLTQTRLLTQPAKGCTIEGATNYNLGPKRAFMSWFAKPTLTVYRQPTRVYKEGICY